MSEADVEEQYLEANGYDYHQALTAALADLAEVERERDGLNDYADKLASKLSLAQYQLTQARELADKLFPLSDVQGSILPQLRQALATINEGETP